MLLDHAQLQRLEMPLAELELSARLLNALEENGMIYVGDALQKTPLEIACIPHIGESWILELFDGLARIGFRRAIPLDWAKLQRDALAAKKPR